MKLVARYCGKAMDWIESRDLALGVFLLMMFPWMGIWAIIGESFECGRRPLE